MIFSDTVRRYNTTERELADFILITDHKPLVYLNSMLVISSRLMRTITELAEFDFEIKYRPGVQNEAAIIYLD